jgi:uracil-DNA glycosylase
MAEETVVYLEDIETQVASQPTQSQGDASVASTSSQTSSSGTVAVNNKRQRTLMDMFNGSHAAKKLKPSASEPALPVKRSMPSGSNLRLNAIPFSLAQYQESLSTDQRRLLALECAYMGKSWCVVRQLVSHGLHSECKTFRLKVLKDEIKKPYFITLKKFLWEEGVRGPDEIPRSLKIFPSRECASQL